MGTDGEHGYLIPRRYWAWLGTRRTLVVALWLVTLAKDQPFSFRAQSADFQARSYKNLAPVSLLAACLL